MKRSLVESNGAQSIHDTLQPMLDQLRDLSEEHRGDPETLLMLLRNLEALHREIQDGAFRASLPEDRQKLFGPVSYTHLTLPTT